MKAINDYRILMPNIPYYETGMQINQFDVVYYTGIAPGAYSVPNFSENVSGPFATGYYYATGRLNSGNNFFYLRPDSVTGPSGPNVWTQKYFFVPTYGSTVNFKATYYENIFQDYYRVILGKSANIIHCDASLQFKGISDNEAKCLNHFYQNSFVANSLSDGQGHKPITMYLFPPHIKSQPFYLKSIDNNFENINFNTVSLNVESPFISSTSWREKLIPFTSEQVYGSSKTYNQHSYVFVDNLSASSNGFYYFTGSESISNVAPPNSPWVKNKFYFSPDLVQQLNFDSTIYKNDLGNFYLYQDEGLNPNFFVFDLSFNNRSDKEAKALLHFLENHNGLDVFSYDMHTFFTGSRNFFCPEWSHTYNYLDNNTISAKFIEFKFSSDRQVTFNTQLKPTGFDFGFLPQGFTKIKEYEVGNNSRRYTITYTIGDKKEDPAYSSAFFSFNPNNKSINVEPGKTGYFDIVFSVPTNLNESAINKDLRGVFDIYQESENVGAIGPTLQIQYTGQVEEADKLAPSPFLSGVQNCVASTIYDKNTDRLGLKVRWTLPGSGYYYTDFSGRISSTSGFGVFTGANVDVELDNTTFLYNIGTPNQTTYSLNFYGLTFNSPYYVSISGVNVDYDNAGGQFVYASGVSNVDAWPNPSFTYSAVNSGLTTGVLSKLGILPPSITLNKPIQVYNLNGFSTGYFDLYKFIVENLPFGNRFVYYSGVIINFNNVQIGPPNAVFYDDVYETGSFIVTGDYSAIVSGVSLNFFNNSSVYGKGGNVADYLNNNSTDNAGRNAIYINCSGLINLSVDDTSIIAGGGGAGDNILFNDIVNTQNNKYATLKDSFNLSTTYKYNGLAGPNYSLTYDYQKVQQLYSDFNNTSVSLNNNFCTTKGAGILYDFFKYNVVVYGGAGAPFGNGNGSSFANKYRVDSSNAEKDHPSQQQSLYSLINLEKDLL